MLKELTFTLFADEANKANKQQSMANMIALGEAMFEGARSTTEVEARGINDFVRSKAYRYRDVEKRRAYQREWMQNKRASLGGCKDAI